MPPDDRAGLIEQDQRGVRGDGELRLYGAVGAAEKLAIIDAEPLADGIDAHGLLLRRAGPFVGDADHLELRPVARLQVAELRNRLAARHAPRAPEVEQQQLALV